MRIKIESNFSFKKLAGKVDSIVDKYKEDVSGAYADGSRKRINDRISPPLADWTVKNRMEGTGDLPLKETGALYRSLKGTKKGLEMLSYGAEHQKGYSNKPWKPVPARRFYGSEYVSKEGEAKAKKSLIKNIRKGMKK